MLALIADSNQQLQTVQLDKPQPAANQVLIKVAAAGVNRPDLMQRQGVYPPPTGASPVLGLEVAGVIEAVSAAVTGFQAGDAVCALVTGGGYAEYCVASSACCLPIPAGFSFVQAAALPETFFTVWSNLFNRAGLQPAETVLIHGGSSGIGTAAIQLAKAFGSRVIVTAGSAEKCRFCLELGADAAIDYRNADFVAAVLQHTDGRGADVILDMIGGDYLPRNLKCLAVEGRLVQIAIQHGAKAELNLWTLMLKRQTLTGSTLRARDDAFKGAIARELQQQVWPLLAAGQIKPVIYATFPLTQADNAHQLMQSSQHIGKLILEVL